MTDYAKKAIQGLLPSKIILAPPEDAIEIPVDKAIEHYTDFDRKKMVKVVEVRELARQGMSQRQISRYCHLSRPAVKKYLDPTFYHQATFAATGTPSGSLQNKSL